MALEVMERRCEMCKTVAPCADVEMTMRETGRVIARFPLCLGCQEEMLATYKDVIPHV